ncbi:GNAT family N-acetyltransferase [Devosia sp.]|uniref:GNAT family N-acetyltransferase n=1 Tax=Devosia sp. TaxID=1871048 RepID=UPI003A8E2814
MSSQTISLSTNRLLLRPVATGDSVLLDAAGTLPDDHFSALPPVDDLIREKGLRSPGDTLSLVVETLASREVVGVVRLTWSQAESGLGQLSFVFDAAHAHRGYCVEAIQALMDMAFTQLPFERLSADCDNRNGAREKPLQRLGLSYRIGSVTPDGKRTYEISRDEWARFYTGSQLVA